ncbi:hypothetical protein [Neorhizobium alkalisoli]|uniref:Uncharacterized protein n=1 Tax=Neorhizobium alkalisoli TaxID=528178 RepID=A0A561QSV7_9HYPH|nr:hypothetical protein [Neorhizobium alkalisoli]TWF53389.1 hypothetical protein FHW37_104668 [Neorhizobium alkalisoli]
MTASGQFAAAGPARTMFDLPFDQSGTEPGWMTALVQIEHLADFRSGRQGSPVTVTFEKERLPLKHVFAGNAHPVSDARIVLPVRNALSDRLRRLSGSKSPTRFAPDAFTLSLLTFLERNRRIGLVGDDTNQLKAALVRHAPWHDFVEIDMSGKDTGDFDLVIVDLKRREHQSRAAQSLAGLQTGLVIVTDGSLGRLEA